MSSSGNNRYDLAEDIASSVTHGVGAALGAAALGVLVTLAVFRGDTWRVISFAVYGLSLFFLYLFSSFYHAVRNPRLKLFFRYLDHSAIYLLIAGTYTPFLLVKMRGPWGWSLFGVIWGLAILGIVFNFVLLGQSRVLSGLVYIGMGWLVVVAIKPLLNVLPPGGLAWLVAGGLSYSFGVFFYVARKLPFNHAIWHLFVLGGSTCHFVAILLYVLPD
jgi:hemolysin III